VVAKEIFVNSALFKALRVAAFPSMVPALMVVAGGATAQTPPSAGTLLQQIEQGKKPELPSVTPVVPTPATAEVKDVGAKTAVVSQFVFVGNTILSQAQLGEAVSAYVGRSLSFAELQQAATAVAERYREAGWIVKVYVPEQKISGGIVSIRVIEAKFGAARIEGERPTHIAPERVLSFANAQLKPGEVLNMAQIDRLLLTIDDLPGISAVGSLAEGKTEGETDVSIRLTDTARAFGSVDVGNASSRASGSEAITGNLFIDSPGGIGDQLTASVSHSAGLDYLRLGYSLPMGSNGWRVRLNASGLNYAFIVPEFETISPKGSSNVVGLELTYPLLRARSRNVYLTIGLDDKKFKNTNKLGTVSDYGMGVYSVAMNGNMTDGIGGGGINVGSVNYASGQVNLDGSPNQVSDAATTRTHGNFSRLRYALSREQALFTNTSLFGSYSGQVASSNLDSSERFYLGGANGVRAYPGNEGGGSEGELATIELRQRFAGNLTLAGFYDWGAIKVNRNNNFLGSATPNTYTLHGYGLSLAAAFGSSVSVKATWARRDGDNPSPTPTGRDQDGSLDLDRFWLQVSMSF
jgi:hemolysin activation/secretion protein